MHGRSSHYKCQRIYQLYDTVVTADDGRGIAFVNTTGGSASAFDIDLEAAHITGKNSICVDYDSSMNEGCSNEVGAKIKDSLTGCFDGPVGKLLCGLSLEIKHGDLSTVETTGNLFYPRVLLAGGEDHDGDGRSDPEMVCVDPIGASSPQNPPLPVQTTALTHPLFLVHRLLPKMPLPGAHLQARGGRAALMRTLRPNVPEQRPLDHHRPHPGHLGGRADSGPPRGDLLWKSWCACSHIH